MFQSKQGRLFDWAGQFWNGILMGFPDGLFLFLSDGLRLRMFCFVVPAFIERFAFAAALAGSLRVVFCDKGIALPAFESWF